MLFTIYKCSAAVSHTQQFNNFLLEHKYSRFWRFLIVLRGFYAINTSSKFFLKKSIKTLRN